MARSIASATAELQELAGLVTNRNKRHRSGRAVVEGVRPISVALAHGWRFEAVVSSGRARLSDWAASVVARVGDDRHLVVPEPLMRRLTDRDELPELVGVVATPARSIDDVGVHDRALVVVLDRPSSPGNVGTVVRTADAFAADAVIVTGHAADPWDPRAIRASTGSVFSLPVVVAGSAAAVEPLLDRCRVVGARIVGADEAGSVDVDRAALGGPLVLVLGNEARGLGHGWRDACDELVRVPMRGSATSLNVAAAAAVVLYEADRQRRAAVR